MFKAKFPDVRDGFHVRDEEKFEKTNIEHRTSNVQHRMKNISLLLIGIYILLYLIPLGARPLFIPDETRYAEVPREMIASGDWIVPRINGLRYFEKPVMGYWISALSIMTWGENNFAVRLPSALAAGLTVLLVMVVCRSSCSRQSDVPWLSSLVLLTCLGVISIGTFAVLDGVLTLFLTATLVSFFLATEQKPGSRPERFYLVAAGIMAGCAFLTKGFLAFAVPVLTVAPYLIWQKRWRDCFRMLWLPLAGAILISLPWGVLIHQREQDFWKFFVINEHLRRFLADNAQHTEPFWYFLVALPCMFLPWIFVSPSIVSGLLPQKSKENQAQKRLLQFCLCWLIFPLIFFSASSGKLLTYILPCFPAIAILTALGLNQTLLTEKAKKQFQTGTALTLFVISSVMLSLLLLQLFGPVQFRPFTRSWKWLMLVNGLIMAILLLIVSFRTDKRRQKIVFFALAPVPLMFLVHFTMPTLTLNVKAPGLLIERHRGVVDQATTIFSGEEVARAAPWYFKRDDIFLIERAGELDYGLGYDDAKQRLFTPKSAGKYIRDRQGRVILVAEDEEYDRWRKYLPRPTAIDTVGKFIFLSYH